MEVNLLLVLSVYFVNTILWHLQVNAIVVAFEQVVEGIVLLWDFLATRWVNFYELQQRLDQESLQARVPSVKKLIFVLFLHLWLFPLLLLEIT